MNHSPSNRLFVATRKGLFTLERAASGWKIAQTAFLGDPISIVHIDRAGRIYAALDLGHFGTKLQRSTDGGATWELNRPLWDKPERKGWFGGGYDWPGIHSVVVDPRNPERVLVGISCGGVWETLDAGATWSPRAQGMRAEYMPPERAYDQNVQDPHIMVASRDNPDALWVQHHNGIFRSTDGAASWQEIKDIPRSGFGFAAAAHPEDPDTAWFVPAIKDEKRIPVDGQLVALRTRDGGKSFDVLDQGLPQENAYDLIYRHSLDIDASGDSLAFGSTTGSLWITEDQGDSWTSLSEHLPPIYCVRFAA